MSSAVPFKFNTAASTNLQVVRALQTANVKGITCPGAAAAMFLKLYWFVPTTAAPTPVVGTAVPQLTFQIPTTGLVVTFSDGVTGNGQLWVAVTGLAADSDTTAVTSGTPITISVE